MESHLQNQSLPVPRVFKQSPRKYGSEVAQSPSPLAEEGTANGCFDCNICLDFTVDPVVTFCGHLYCWPCIYRWLELETTSPRQCPVCKATLSETTLVPLYGRGSTTNKESSLKGSINIPRRPAIQHRGRTLAASLVEPGFPSTTIHRHRRHHHHHRPTADYDHFNVQTLPENRVSYLLGSAAVAMLPWVFGEQISTRLQYSNRYYLIGEESSPSQRRQEMLAGRSLQRVSVFLLCSMFLCLLLF